AAVHHEVVDLPFPFDVAGESLFDGRPREFGEIGTFAVGFFIPVRDGEPGIRGLVHLSPRAREAAVALGAAAAAPVLLARAASASVASADPLVVALPSPSLHA